MKRVGLSTEAWCLSVVRSFFLLLLLLHRPPAESNPLIFYFDLHSGPESYFVLSQKEDTLGNDLKAMAMFHSPTA